MAGILSYGAYVPHWRLKRSAIGAVLGTPPAPGARAVASYDEDSTTMGVEAARVALTSAPAGAAPEALYFATATPAYLDKTNATAIHAALGLSHGALAVDMAGAVRSGVGALRAALDATRPVLVVVSDVRTGLPGGPDEREGGDGAAAVLCGSGPVVAELLGQASVTREFLDRWRLPAEPTSRRWEERFGEHVLAPLGEEALREALKEAGLAPGDVDHVVVTGTHARACRQVSRACGARKEALVDDLSAVVGVTGTAHPLLLLASVLDRAEPGQTVAMVVLADGADAFVLRTTEALSGCRSAIPVADQIASGRDDLPYGSFLTWRGQLRREPPRRPDPSPPAAPPAARSEAWKFGLVGSRCVACGTRHLPPARTCWQCGSVDQMRPEPLAGAKGTVTTYSVDHLSFSLSPPVVVAVVDLDEGGRLQCELTDVDPDRVAVGDRVELSFRLVGTAQSIHNYFWKARPLRRPAN